MAKITDNDTIVQQCEEAVNLWGQQSQEDMCIEECSELIKAIIKMRRGQATHKMILEEIVDVQIMLVQMRVIINDEDNYWKIFNNKIERLKNIIEKSKSMTKGKHD